MRNHSPKIIVSLAILLALAPLSAMAQGAFMIIPPKAQKVAEIPAEQIVKQEEVTTSPTVTPVSHDNAQSEATVTCVDCALRKEPSAWGAQFAADFEAMVPGIKALMETDSSGGTMISPIKDKVCHLDSRRFGCRAHPLLGYVRPHKGIDLNSNGHPFNRIIVSPMEGVVVERASGKLMVRHCQRGYFIRDGRVSDIPCQIQMSDGSTKSFTLLETAYLHVSTLAGKAKLLSTVNAGEVIAKAGSVGLSSGVHLHYEVHANGMQVDPMSFHRAQSICNSVERGEALFAKKDNGQCSNHVEAYR